MTMPVPDLARRQLVERFHFTDGNGRDESFCGIEWQPLPDGRLLVVAWEHPDNPSASVTNAAEQIYQQFIDQTGVDPARIVWTECYPPERGESPIPRFDRCTFTREADGTVEPHWQPMGAEHWRELGTAPPAVPSFTRVRPHPETIDAGSPLPDDIGDYYPPPRPAGPRGEVIYRGSRGEDGEGTEVTVNDVEGTRTLHPRLDLQQHSPSGFEWGYAGSGPAQLSLAMLADLTDDATAKRHYLTFKNDVIARLPEDHWEVTATEIRAALVRYAQQRPPAPGMT